MRRHRAYKSHILTKKHPKRKRHLRKGALVARADEARLRQLLMA
jgi:large subunit ribosomal protein L35